MILDIINFWKKKLLVNDLIHNWPIILELKICLFVNVFYLFLKCKWERGIQLKRTGNMTNITREVECRSKANRINYS